MSNVGYAFVNFKSHEYASKCIEAFHNYRFKRPLDSKSIVYSRFCISRLVQFDADASRIMNFETLPQSLRSSQDLRQSGSRLSCSPSGVEGDFVNCMEVFAFQAVLSLQMFTSQCRILNPDFW